MEKEIRLLRANEIEVRVSSINEKGVSLLLYVDARADMKILDEVFGVEGWQRRHMMVGDNLYCSILIWDEKKMSWIEKMDVGTAGFTEKEKSLSSDSFKRCCTVVGVGRELYTAPFIWVSADKVDLVRRLDKLYCNTRFSVKDVEYSAEREITALTIVNDKGEEVYKYSKVISYKNGSAKNKKLTKTEIKKLDDELMRTGVSWDEVKERYDVGSSTSDVSPEIYSKLMVALQRTQSA